MDNKYEAAGNTGQSNAETGWEGVAAMADDFQTDKPVAEAGTQQPETISQPEVVLSASNNVYREIAKDALKNWNGLSDEEASEKVSGASVEELESQVYAGDSIKAAVNGISKVLNEKGVMWDRGQKIASVEWNDNDKLLESVLNGSKQDAIFSELGDKIKKMFEYRLGDDAYQPEDFILDVLDNIHTDWIEHNSKKFFDEKRLNKQYQFMPLDLIGFKEAMADNIFLEPILKATGMKMPEEGLLEGAFDERRTKFARQLNLEEKVFKEGAEPDWMKHPSKGSITQALFTFNFPKGKVPENLQNIYDALGDEETAARVIQQCGTKSEDMVFIED